MPYIDKLTNFFDPSNLSAFGTLETNEIVPVVQMDFVYGINSQTGVTSSVSGSSIDINSSRLRLQSGTSSSGSAIFTSRRTVRYRPGQGVMARFTSVFDSYTANNSQYAGVGTSTDGYFFGNSGSAYGIIHRNGSSEVFTSQSSWNGDKANGSGSSGFVLNPQFGNVYMIKYPYLGYGNIGFYIEDRDTSRFILAHTIKYTNTTQAVQLTNPNLNFYCQNINNGNTTNKTMYIGSVGIFSDGERGFISSPQWCSDFTKTTTTTTETHILSIKNCNSYNGVINRGLLRLNVLSISNSNNTNVTVRFRIGATIGGSPSFTPINGTTADQGVTITNGNSIASVDTAGTTVTPGSSIYFFNSNLGPNGSEVIDLSPYELFIAPGETLNITAQGSGASSVGISINWKEDV